MDQVRFSRTSFGTTSETLFTFDGVILEIFGLTQVLGTNHLNLRFHRDVTTITIGEPDRKGNCKVVINAGGTGPLQLTFGADDAPVIALLERVRAALPVARPEARDPSADCPESPMAGRRRCFSRAKRQRG
jgi:hypothetical protein